MTLILTAPQRICMMAIDASTQIKDGSAYFAENVDETRRPFVLVEPGQEDIPAVAAGMEAPTEEYTLTLIAEKYGQGARGEAEAQLRTITADILDYFAKRTQLQFRNLRGLQPAPLPSLVGVMWARLYLRTYAGVVTKGGTEGEQPFYGCVFSIRVQTVANAEEDII